MFKRLNQLFHKLILSQLAYEVWTSFKYFPDDWEGYEDNFRIKHKTNKISIWTGNGRWFFNIEHDNDHRATVLIGLIDRHLVWPVFRMARRKFKNIDRYSIRNTYIKQFTSNKNKK